MYSSVPVWEGDRDHAVVNICSALFVWYGWFHENNSLWYQFVSESCPRAGKMLIEKSISVSNSNTNFIQRQITNSKKRKKKSRTLLLCLSSQLPPPANGSISLQHRAVLQVPPDPVPPPRMRRSCPWRSKLGKADSCDVLWQGKAVECPLWCFERKLYRNNVPSSVAIENPSQKEFATRGKAA